MQALLWHRPNRHCGSATLSNGARTCWLLSRTRGPERPQTKLAMKRNTIFWDSSFGGPAGFHIQSQGAMFTWQRTGPYSAEEPSTETVFIRQVLKGESYWGNMVLRTCFVFFCRGGGPFKLKQRKKMPFFQGLQEWRFEWTPPVNSSTFIGQTSSTSSGGICHFEDVLQKWVPAWTVFFALTPHPPRFLFACNSRGRMRCCFVFPIGDGRILHHLRNPGMIRSPSKYQPTMVS